MSSAPLAVQRCGLVTSVGLSAPAACAALRGKLTNPTETRFMSKAGHWLMAHEVPLERPWRGLDKLARMAAMALEECLDGVPAQAWAEIPLLLCVAERERPGRIDGLDDALLPRIQELLGHRFAPTSAVVPHGRAALPVALAAARKLLAQPGCTRVVVVGVDGLLHWPTLDVHDRAERLLTEQVSNGFMPGEAAGALRLGVPQAEPALCVTGIGFAVEPAHIDSGEPLRGDGLAQAIRQALGDAGRRMEDLDFRIADLSGEQYYFKEAALALARTLHTPKASFDLWHPAEAIGETGAAIGPAMLALIEAACFKGYAPGHHVLAHFANDAGQRAALVLQFTGGTP